MTPLDLDVILDEFSGWLSNLDTPSAPLPQASAPVDLFTLIGQFTALRHDVNMQTRAVRNAVDQMSARPEPVPVPVPVDAPVEDPWQSLLKPLLDAYDALALAGRQIERQRERLGQLIAAATPPISSGPLAASSESRAWWRRPGTVSPPPPPVTSPALTEVGSRVRETLDALLAGYTMSLTRLDALVQLAGLEPFDYTGQPFDPETMEVLELVVGTEFADGQVLEVVRRGYRRAGRIYRYSQVRVARRTPRG